MGEEKKEIEGKPITVKTVLLANRYFLTVEIGNVTMEDGTEISITQDAGLGTILFRNASNQRCVGVSIKALMDGVLETNGDYLLEKVKPEIKTRKP